MECFKEHDQVGKEALELLKAPDVLKDPVLATYLVFLCEGLSSVEYKQSLFEISQTEKLSKELVHDIQVVIKTLV